MQMHADEDTFYIIDGYGFIFRAFYALPNLTSRTTGEPIGAVYGFFKMLISIINSAKPSHLAIALDTGKRTFRNDVYDKFCEDKSLEVMFQENKMQFDLAGIKLEDVRNFSPEQLIELLQLDKQHCIDVCEKLGVPIAVDGASGVVSIPKILLLDIFLHLEKDIKIEDFKTQYKANRRETPDELKSQFKIVRELIDFSGIRAEFSYGFEADDVIASLAKEAVKRGMKVVVVSADKDLCQLVKDGEISVYDPAKKQYLDEQGVIGRFGVRADQIVDYLSIVGDHCDNVFGVNGIGPKGAIKLLQQYNSIENIFANIGKLDDRTRQKFEASKDVLALAQELIKLRFDAVDIDTMDDYRLHLDNDKLSKFITKYGFREIDSDARRFGNYSNAVKEKKVVEQKGLF